MQANKEAPKSGVEDFNEGGVEDVNEGGDDVEWVMVDPGVPVQEIVSRNHRKPDILCILVTSLEQLIRVLRILGNLAKAVKVMLSEEVNLSVGQFMVQLPPNSFVIQMDNQEGLVHLSKQLSAVMAFPVYVPYLFWRRITHNSQVRMWALLHSSQMVYPHFADWHLLSLLYQEAGLEFPNSLSLVVREQVSHTLSTGLMFILMRIFNREQE